MGSYADLNLVLYVASYGDTATAKQDYQSLKQLDDAAVIHRWYLTATPTAR